MALTGCTHPDATQPDATQPDAAQPGLRYLDQTRIPSGSTFGGTVVGGLSAISYDPGRDCYYVISDDRSVKNPARFYTVTMDLSGNAIADLKITGTHWLLDVNGAPFRSRSLVDPPVVPPDPEGIAFDPARQQLYWSSEGERLTDTPIGPVLADPWIRIAALDGSYLGRFTMPANLAMSAQRTGPRRNTTLEGLTLASGGRLLFAAMEGPRYDDGAPPDLEHGAPIRVTAFDVESTAPIAQYVYWLEPATEPARTNGLSDLVALSETEFLVLERAFSLRSSIIRIFHAEIGAATDVLAVSSLTDTPVTPMRKTLLVDLSAALPTSPLDNLEGITLGPVLADGRQSVVLVGDDNFSPRQATQFVLLAN